MQIQGVDALAGMAISMSSPDFYRTNHHCLTFEYEVRAPQSMPGLEIHVRMTDYELSGDKIWSSEDYSYRRDYAHTTIEAVENSKDITYVLDFVGVLADPRTTLIRIANVGFSSGPCGNETDLSVGDIAGNTITQDVPIATVTRSFSNIQRLQ